MPEGDARPQMNDDRRRRFGGVAGRTLALVCECGDPDCRRTVLLTAEEYDAVRPQPVLHPEHGRSTDGAAQPWSGVPVSSSVLRPERT